MRSPRSVPPGSRVSTTSRPSAAKASARRRACVDFPEPSTPSKVTNIGAARRIVRCAGDRDRWGGLHRLARRRTCWSPAATTSSCSTTSRTGGARTSTRARSLSSSTSATGRRAGAFADARPEVCFHLAAQADVRVSVERPDYDCRGERPRHDQPSRGCPRARDAAGLLLHRRRDLRRVRRARDRGGRARPLAPYGTAKLAGRGVPRHVQPPLRQRAHARSATATSTGRVRTLTARPGSSRSSSAGSPAASSCTSTATGGRSATTSSWPTWRRPPLAAGERPAGVFNVGTAGDLRSRAARGVRGGERGRGRARVRPASPRRAPAKRARPTWPSGNSAFARRPSSPRGSRRPGNSSARRKERAGAGAN